MAEDIDFTVIAEACGYPRAVCVSEFDELDAALEEAKICDELCFIEVKCSIGARNVLGRPTASLFENKQRFMEYLGAL